ncbi:MAG: FAD-binding oxidoreductase [Nitriliruptoraceae bacterium]
MTAPSVVGGDDPLVGALTAVVGDAHVLSDPALTAAYETDWSRRWSGRARLVVRPADTRETAEVVAACREHDAAVVTQGGNTGLVGGGVPRGGEVVVSTARMTGLGAVDPIAGQVTAGAGVTIAALHEHAAAAGFVYGVDLGSRDSATVGGTIATEAGGVRVVRYGSTRAQVMGLEAVLPDASVISRLDGLVKDNVGYDLPGLLVGSEGTLGIVTRARLRLHPHQPHRVAALLAVGSVAAALEVFARLRAAVDGLAAVELITQDGLDLVVDLTGATSPFSEVHPVYLLVEVAGRSDPTDELGAVVADLAEVRDAAVATDPPSRARLWQLREGHTEAIAAIGPPPHKLDVSVPLPALPELAERAPRVVAEVDPTARTVLFGHVGDGNLHVNVVGPDSDDDRTDAAVFSLVAELGGSISAEHGIGVQKRAYLGLGRDAADRAAMRRIKDAFDPEGRFNPGVLFEA